MTPDSRWANVLRGIAMSVVVLCLTVDLVVVAITLLNAVGWW